MATFKEIRGQTIKKYTTNPTNPLEGQMWYNNTTGTLKVYTVGTASWASGTAAPTATSGAACVGVQTSAMMWGGDTGGPYPSWPTASFSYDGSTWTSAGAIPAQGNAFGQAGATSSTALAFGGGNNGPLKTGTMTYNGSSWSTDGTLSTARVFYSSGAGTQTTAIALCGGEPSAGDKHENYDGSSWTAEVVFPTASANTGVTGSQTAALGFLGTGPAPSSVTASWDGSSWTASSPAMNDPRQYGAAGGATSESSYIFGGQTGSNTTNTEWYNGTTWATQPTMANARGNYGGCGIQSNALLAGSCPPGVTAVEEFTAAALEVQTVTTS